MRNITGGGLREGRDEKARERIGLSQEESDGKSGVSRSVVVFAGLGPSLPQRRNRRNLADASDVDLDGLWG